MDKDKQIEELQNRIRERIEISSKLEVEKNRLHEQLRDWKEVATNLSDYLRTLGEK
jgi:regulator of replication initiation timing